jgi:hypothetical protein
MKQHNNDNIDPFQPLGLAAERLVKSLSQSQELAVGALSGRSKSSGGLFDRVEGAKTLGAISDPDLGVEPAARTNIDTFDTEGRTSLTVPSVLLNSGLAEILNSIIVLDSIDMVDHRTGPSPIDVKPREPVSGICHSVNANDAVAGSDSTRDLPGEIATHLTRKNPTESSGIFRIVEDFAKTFKRDATIAGPHHSEPREQQKEQRERDAQRDRDTEQKQVEQRAYIEQRLRDVAAFESRFDPGYRSRRKRK